MARRRVSLPARIERVVTLGSLPVLNSFVFTMGEGRTLVNGLADFARPHWKYQTLFAPQLAGPPTMQLPNREPNVEAILLGRPDVVLTMHRESVAPLAARGVKVIFLAWREPEDVKACMTTYGRGLRQAARWRALSQLFRRDAGARGRRAAPVTAAERPRVLYLQPGTLTQPRLIAEWWIPAAGGISVTDDGRTAESRTFSLEQVLLWDPDILIVTTPKDVPLVRNDRAFAGAQGGAREQGPCRAGRRAYLVQPHRRAAADRAVGGEDLPSARFPHSTSPPRRVVLPRVLRHTLSEAQIARSSAARCSVPSRTTTT